MKKPATQDFQLIAGNLALDFVNTVGNRLSQPREYLVDNAEFNRWASLAGLLPQNAPLSLGRHQLKSVRSVREDLYRLFQPIASGTLRGSRMLAPLNARLAAVAPKRQLACLKGNVYWHWESSANDPDLILAPILLSAADLLVGGWHPKVRQCEGETCGWLFLDRSPAGRRRWCSMADCGNRAKVRKFYLQQKKARAAKRAANPS